jgi:hypothetical protein
MLAVRCSLNLSRAGAVRGESVSKISAIDSQRKSDIDLELVNLLRLAVNAAGPRKELSERFFRIFLHLYIGLNSVEKRESQLGKILKANPSANDKGIDVNLNLIPLI